MRIKKLRRRPAPGIRIVAQLPTDYRSPSPPAAKRPRSAASASRTNLIRPSIGTSSPIPRHDANVDAVVTPCSLLPAPCSHPMRRQQLRHPFHVPTRSAPAEEPIHERMRPFVQQQMPAIVVARLIASPTGRTRSNSRAAVRASGGISSSAANFSRSPIEKRPHSPVRRRCRIDAKIRRPQRHRRIEHRRQRIHRRPRRQIGVEHQMSTFELANAGRLQTRRFRRTNRYRLGRDSLTIYIARQCTHKCKRQEESKIQSHRRHARLYHAESHHGAFAPSGGGGRRIFCSAPCCSSPSFHKPLSVA